MLNWREREREKCVTHPPVRSQTSQISHDHSGIEPGTVDFEY